MPISQLLSVVYKNDRDDYLDLDPSMAVLLFSDFSSSSSNLHTPPPVVDRKLKRCPRLCHRRAHCPSNRYHTLGVGTTSTARDGRCHSHISHRLHQPHLPFLCTYPRILGPSTLFGLMRVYGSGKHSEV